MRPEEELYDCLKDPFQLNNLAYNEDYAEIKKGLSEKLIDNLKKTGDPRIMGEADQFDEYPYYGSAPFHPSISKP